jgi:hypothetical protein
VLLLKHQKRKRNFFFNLLQTTIASSDLPNTVETKVSYKNEF